VNERRKTQVQTERRVALRTVTQAALERAGLSNQEAQVVRMRHGLGEAHDAPLCQRGLEFDEIRAKLSMMEAAAIEALREAATPATSVAPAAPSAGVASVPVDEAKKHAIIERLKRMS